MAILRRSVFLALLSAAHAHAIVGGMELRDPRMGAAAANVALQMTYPRPLRAPSYGWASGVLIGRRVVLTAAHNLRETKQAAHVEVIFSAVPCWNENTCGERRIRATRLLPHPKFTYAGQGVPTNDIALVFLAEDAPSSAAFARLPSLTNATSVTASGYGLSLDLDTPSAKDFRLRQVEIPLANAAYRLGAEPFLRVDQRRGGFCNGDSGGPAFAQDEVVGIASYTHGYRGRGCDGDAYFTDVTHYLEWIRAQLR